jgi:hypothetical protein
MNKIILACLCFIFANCHDAHSENGDPKSLISEVNGKKYKSRTKYLPTWFSNALKIDGYYYVIGQSIDIRLINVVVFQAMSTKPSDFLVYKLDTAMNVVSVGVVPSVLEKKEVMSHELRKVGNNLCAFFYFNNRKTMKQYYFARLIDMHTLKPLAKGVKVGEQGLWKKELKAECKFDVKVSSGLDRLFVTGHNEKTGEVSLCLLDQDLRIINSKPSYSVDKLLSQYFDNDGNICLLELRGNDYHASIVRTDGSTERINLDMDAYKFRSIRIQTTPGKKTVSVIAVNSGTFALERRELDLSSGEFVNSLSGKVNPGNTVASGITSLLSTVKSSELRFGDCHIDENNEIILVLQEFYYYTVSETRYEGNYRIRYDAPRYVYGNIVAIRYSADDQVKSFSVVSHSSTTEWDVERDYHSVYRNGRLFLITKTGGCVMEFNNGMTEQVKFRGYDTFKRKKYFAHFLNASETDIIHITRSAGRRVNFTLLSLRLD